MQGDINARWQGTGGTCSKTWAFLSPLMNGKGTDNIFTCHCSKKPTTQFGKMLWGWLNWMVRPQPAKQNWPVLTNCSQDICLHSGNLKCLGIIRGSSRSNILTCGEVNTCHKHRCQRQPWHTPKLKSWRTKMMSFLTPAISSDIGGIKGLAVSGVVDDANHPRDWSCCWPHTNTSNTYIYTHVKV